MHSTGKATVDVLLTLQSVRGKEGQLREAFNKKYAGEQLLLLTSYTCSYLCDVRLLLKFVFGEKQHFKKNVMQELLQ